MKPTAVSLILIALLASATPGSAASREGSGRRIQVAVTSKGFEPASIPVKVGQRVVLVITRKTDRTCAKEIVIADRKIRKVLPLNRPVEIHFVAEKPGSVRFACGMDMVGGRLVVE